MYDRTHLTCDLYVFGFVDLSKQNTISPVLRGICLKKRVVDYPGAGATTDKTRHTNFASISIAEDFAGRQILFSS